MNDTSHHTDTSRLEAFSDGVFAIAITLLVLEIAVPQVAGGDLAGALQDEWPSFFGFALSFVNIGIMWMNHHEMFKDIERTDHSLQVLNLLLLLGISFVPFSTAVLAAYLEDGDGLRSATLLYAGNYTFIAIFFSALWLWAYSGRRLIDEHVSEARLRSRTRRYLPGPLIYGLGLPLSFLTPWLTIGVYTAMAVLYLLPLNE